MHKINPLWYLFATIVLCAMLFCCHHSQYRKIDQSRRLNLYVCGNYLPDDIIQQFTKETGIKIRVTEYDNNETMFTKLKTLKNSGYDIISPSSYYVEKMHRNSLLYPLNLDKIPNFKHLHPLLLDLPYDPKNRYSIPIMWGTTGIIVNRKYIDPATVTSWQDLWQPRFRNQLMILDDMRDVFSVALMSIGYSINTEKIDEINAAYQKLRELLPNIKVFNIDTVPNIYIDNDVVIGIAWSGDAYLAKSENPDLTYIYPKEGYPLWIENVVILKDAPHVDNAHRFIDFLLRPEVAASMMQLLGYSSANRTALKLLPPKFLISHVDRPLEQIYPKAAFLRDLDDRVGRIYDKAWEHLKMGD